MNKPVPIHQHLLQVVSVKHEIVLSELLTLVPANTKTHLDFYPLAVLLHAGYLQSDTTTSSGALDEKNFPDKRGRLGFDTRETALLLFDVSKDSKWATEVRVFLTASGNLKLEEIQERQAALRAKQTDYRMSLLIAVLAALISSSAGYLLGRYLA
jgi:hypothetical protein